MRVSRRVAPPAPGFTLLEMLIAIAIIVTCTALTWTSFSQTARNQQEVTRRSDAVNMGRMAVERITRELGNSFLSTHVSPTSSFRTLFRGDDKDPFDEVVFTSLSHEKLYQDAREGDATELSYSRDDGEGGLYSLVHREAPRVDGDPERGGTLLPLCHRVKKLNFRYFDSVKQEWVENWDSDGAENVGKLPRAIEVTLTVVDEDQGEHTFTSRTLVNRLNR